ncbi:ABC transporter related protein [Cellulomonas flavigena DSM 20109]|uniref:ABC transporter related protein n=1 Tax=Cellulomonas flavigena (strain ATCC 482 / DSM 20109 / BCRC 11376 / JCM 18109 / NBRC 3775 / NCIMB 8073 / NRS 134) TaxID=446466 RepID=D5UDK6_CELFN|nr:ABC transporter ATP-binding protein [Cellulomonas flavigena]ADG76462.1 ABC transporter related protein [Cellulomonas flavigena DSM 20109]
MTGRVLRTVREALGRQREIARLTARAGSPGLVAGLVVVGVLLGVLPVVFVLATSATVGAIPGYVTAGDATGAWEALVPWLLLASGALAVQQVLAQVEFVAGELLARRIDRVVVDDLLQAVLRTPDVGPLEDPVLLDDLAEATREIDAGHHSPGAGCCGQLALIPRYLQLLGLVTVAGVALGWWAAVVLGGATLMFRYGVRTGLRSYAAVFPALARTGREADYYREIGTRAGAAKEIRVFGLIGWLRGRYVDTYRAWMAPVWVARRRIYLRPYLVYAPVGLVLAGTVLVSAGLAAARGALPVDALVLVVQCVLGALLLGDFYPEADMQTEFGMYARRAIANVERAVDDSPYRAAASDAPTLPVPVPVAAQPVRFSRVGFQYPGTTRRTLDELDLVLEPGRCTAVVGANGAGKTTLVKLLTRLYEPTAGAVLVGDVPIDRVDAREWRRHVSVVFQDFLRYELTLAENIAFGSVEHLDDSETVRAVVRDVGLQDLVDSLPRGLATPLSSRLVDGVDLSGGQWQRIAIARALFAVRQGAGVLVLDEPTASLDVRAEVAFHEEIRRHAAGVTTLLISHRFATVRHADTIVVLGDGRVEERGTHDELMDLGGTYAHLFDLQASRFEEVA